MRVERAPLHADRHRRRRLRRTGRARRLDPRAGPRRHRRRPRSRCWSSTPAPGCAPATRSSPTCCAAPPLPAIVAANKCDTRRRRPAGRRVPRPRPRRADRGLRRPGPRHAATCWTASSSCSRCARGEEAEDAEERIRLAVIGRPNVGKSSLVNRFLGEERVIVSDRAGTTRDAIDTQLRFGEQRADARRHGRACAAPPRSATRSSTTRLCARGARPSAPTSRWSSATPSTASPPRICGSPSWR